MNLQDLIKMCDKPDKEVQRTLFESSKDMAMSICMRYAKNECEANEILRQGFVFVFNDIKNGIKESDSEKWIINKMIDAAVEVLKKNKQEYKIASTVNVNRENAQHDNMSDQEVVRIMSSAHAVKAMQALTPSYRLVANLHLVDGYSFRQISEKTDVGEETIRLNFDKAMYQLRKNIVQLTAMSHA